jgi:hypothetical protein
VERGERAKRRSSYIVLGEELQRPFFSLLYMTFFFSVAEGGEELDGWVSCNFFFSAESAVAVM